MGDGETACLACGEPFCAPSKSRCGGPPQPLGQLGGRELAWIPGVGEAQRAGSATWHGCGGRVQTLQGGFDLDQGLTGALDAEVIAHPVERRRSLSRRIRPRRNRSSSVDRLSHFASIGRRIA
jgi:hypothetical protein